MVEDDETKPEPAPEPATDAAKPEPVMDEAKPESTKEPPPPPLVHPPPGPPPPTPIRILKSVATVAAIAGLFAVVALVAQYLGRDPAPQDTLNPVDSSHLDDEPPPLSTVPTPFGIDDLDASAPFVPDDDTTDAAAQYQAFLHFDGGRHTGHRTHDGGE